MSSALAAPATSRGRFLAGVFLVCAATLMLQVVQTRILSVITFYHLAFLAISLAMFGLTLGALWVHRQPPPDVRDLQRLLSRACSGFAIATVASLWLLSTTAVLSNLGSSLVMQVAIWLKVIVVLLPPYVFAGSAISLALTRSPFPVPLVYAVDLAGAATGCLGTLALLSWIDGPSAMLAVAAIGSLAAACFVASLPGKRVRPLLPAASTLALASIALTNAALHPSGLIPALVKDRPQYAAHDMGIIRWNSFSRTRLMGIYVEPPMSWGPSEKMPTTPVEQFFMDIDGDAGTPIYRFSGNPAEIDFLRYDVTALAYWIRASGRSAVIGVGGGRDVQTAWLFGFRDITGIELNPIFVDYLTRGLREFNAIADQPGVRLIADEARSWFARSRERFDLIQMSLIDTWAATGVGAFSLSENGLYTVEGFGTFVSALEPGGVFTVSRWFSPDNVDESARILSLAKATLMELGATAPDRHLFLAARDRVATLVLARNPLSSHDLAGLRATCAELGYLVLYDPGRAPQGAVLQSIRAAGDRAALDGLARLHHLDLSPPTDDQPFFFNQLRLSDPRSMRAAAFGSTGVFRGNLLATLSLVIIIGLSALLVLATVVVPAFASARSVDPALVWLGSSWFVAIGMGFMLVEIGLIQRLGVYLGHPVYGLAIGLTGIIASTGVGALLSGWAPLARPALRAAWAAALAAWLLALPFWLPNVLAATAAQALVGRSLVALSLLLPTGILMGYAFPTGMALVEALDRRPTPWFWAVNGAAGVLASGLAIAIGIELSIDANLWIGAGCYLALVPVGLALGLQANRGQDASAALERRSRPVA
ncbi:MAG TPA: hypothetical protein VLC53_13880 [Myxococcota bacterium]|nr:hypothetical protein [Myxococcota bacterium]